MGRKRTMREQDEAVRYLGTKVIEDVYYEFHKLAIERRTNVGVMLRDLIMKEIAESKKAVK